jgi:hypothetical protein
MATPAVTIRKGPHTRTLYLLALFGVVLAAGVVSWLLAVDLWSGKPSRGGPSGAAVAAFEERTGVQLVRVAVTGSGGIVDLRYRVLDVDRSAIVHDPTQRPAILDDQTGEVIGEPFMGMWHHHEFVKPGVVYYQLFVNREGLIRPGDYVGVRLGGVILRDVPVT